MTAFIPMATRFSVSDRAAAKVAKPAKLGPFPSVPVLADPGDPAKVAKVGTPCPVELSQVSQAGAAALARESLDLPALSQLSQVSRPGSLKSESGAPDAPPAEPWLAHIARRVAAALAAGAEREAASDGWLLLIRPDGDRLAIKPHIVAELNAAGLLPVLPEPVDQSTYSARARPAEWWDGTDEPKPGDRCRCRGGRFWTERDRRGGWRCWNCHPPMHLKADAIEVIAT